MTEDARGAGPRRRGPAASDIGSPPLRPDAGDPFASTQPNEVAPEPAVDLRAVPWTRAEAVAGGGRLRLHATLDGGPPWAVLARVEVEETPESVTVTLWAGRRADVRPGAPRPAVAFPIAVAVELESPLGRRTLADGAAPRR